MACTAAAIAISEGQPNTPADRSGKAMEEQSRSAASRREF